MVCIYCGGTTRIINSRPQKRLNQTWRRHTCLICNAVFTTNESADLSTSLVVRYPNTTLKPFSRDRLYVSILRAVGHRDSAIDDAGGLVATINAQLLHNAKIATVAVDEIITLTLKTLERFDKAAAVQYQAYHKHN